MQEVLHEPGLLLYRQQNQPKSSKIKLRVLQGVIEIEPAAFFASHIVLRDHTVVVVYAMSCDRGVDESTGEVNDEGNESAFRGSERDEESGWFFELAMTFVDQLQDSQTNEGSRPRLTGTVPRRLSIIDAELFIVAK